MKLADHDERSRESKANEYWVESALPSGRIVCSREGLAIVDFYRTSEVLAKDVPKKEP